MSFWQANKVFYVATGEWNQGVNRNSARMPPLPPINLYLQYHVRNDDGFVQGKQENKRTHCLRRRQIHDNQFYSTIWLGILVSTMYKPSSLMINETFSEMKEHLRPIVLTKWCTETDYQYTTTPTTVNPPFMNPPTVKNLPSTNLLCLNPPCLLLSTYYYYFRPVQVLPSFQPPTLSPSTSSTEQCRWTAPNHEQAMRHDVK